MSSAFCNWKWIAEFQFLIVSGQIVPLLSAEPRTVLKYSTTPPHMPWPRLYMTLFSGFKHSLCSVRVAIKRYVITQTRSSDFKHHFQFFQLNTKHIAAWYPHDANIAKPFPVKTSISRSAYQYRNQSKSRKCQKWPWAIK